MSVLFSNSASTTLSAGVGDSATSITVADGSVFPAITGSDYFYLTLEVDSDPELKEIVKCTARSGNTLTIVRGQDSTSARTFSTADKAQLRLTAAGLNDVATQADTDTTYSVQDGELSQNNFTDADHTKLDGIAASANNYSHPSAHAISFITGLQTALDGKVDDSQVLTNVPANALFTDTNTTYSVQDGELSQNNFTNADHTKLDGIEAGADATDTTNVTAAGSLMDSELTAIASVKALNQGVATTDSPTFTNLTLSGTDSVKVPNGTTAQRNGSPANGMFRYSSTLSAFEGYQAGAWGSIGGGSADITLNQFTGDGSDLTFSLSAAATENNTFVYISGVYQSKSNYTVSAADPAVVTFSTAPPNGTAIEIMSAAISVSNIGTPSDNTVTTAKIVDGAVTTVKIADANVTTAKIVDGAVTATLFNKWRL